MLRNVGHFWAPFYFVIFRLNSDLSELKQVVTGTTIAQLVTATSALSDDEYMCSSVSVTINDNQFILQPSFLGGTTQRRYEIVRGTGSSSQCYGVYEYRQDTSKIVIFIKNVDGSYSETEPTITAWKLVYIKDI